MFHFARTYHPWRGEPPRPHHDYKHTTPDGVADRSALKPSNEDRIED